MTRSSTDLVCASCNPTGARPAGTPAIGSRQIVDDEMWAGGRQAWLAANVPGFTPYADFTAVYQSRYLSDSGRLFFNSHDALVPTDVNGQWDVYEYEPPGIGELHNCHVDVQSSFGRLRRVDLLW